MRTILLGVAACGFMILISEPERQARGQQPQKKKPKGKYDPPDAFMPSADVLKKIETKTAQLAVKIAELRKDTKNHALLPDVEIYLRAAENIVRFKEWYNKASGQWTLDALDRGLERADQLANGKTPWTTLDKRSVLRAYRSVIDGTAQPYGVTYPLDYGKDPKRKWRVDIVLHGRGAAMREIAFLRAHNGTKKIDPAQDWVQIDIFGRGDNAYRWAGETDVMEAIAAFSKGEDSAKRFSWPRDQDRSVVLRGFSMGGAGTWHLGLHYPNSWSVIGPGAGFTTTHDYAWKGKKELPYYQERCLRIYDAIDYAENARMVSIVAYSGSDDPQKKAADNIDNRLKELNIKGMRHIVAPGLGHKMPDEWFKVANKYWKEYALLDRSERVKKISVVTYTLKYAYFGWIWIEGLEKHYEKTSVDAELTGRGWEVSAKNVRTLTIIGFAGGSGGTTNLIINGQKLEVITGGVTVTLEKGKWKQTNSNLFDYSVQQKRQGLQGPIDDAFAGAFVCVLGSGETYHPATQKFVDAKVKAFKYDWAKHWRGELPTTGDYAVTPNDIKDKNLILFGDPQSNLTLAQIVDKLPLKWTKDTIEFGGKKYSAAEHVPVLIFPNPLNPSKYVVLNTGHTWPSEDYVKTNAMLYPRLGDYAILRMDGSVATAGLFDEFWKLEKK